MPILKFICTECGPPRDTPCMHWREQEHEKRWEFVAHALNVIIHILNRPQSATLVLQPKTFHLVGGKMPKTIAPGGSATSLFQEWTGPNGTGTVVPNAGAIAYLSDNPAVATVDATTGVATGVADGTANISGTDSVNNLTASDVLTVQSPAVSATLTLS